jgi:DNA-directed RNA polymerase subunit RPC12/RpoP
MSFFDDLLTYELCFPGAVTGSTEVECPHCGELLTIRVNDPMGEEVYRCRQCSGDFEVDWGEGQVRYDNKIQITFDITLDDENES